MRRNELLNTAAVAQENNASAAPTDAPTENEITNDESSSPKIEIPEECAEAFIAAVEIG